MEKRLLGVADPATRTSGPAVLTAVRAGLAASIRAVEIDLGAEVFLTARLADRTPAVRSALAVEAAPAACTAGRTLIIRVTDGRALGIHIGAVRRVRCPYPRAVRLQRQSDHRGRRQQLRKLPASHSFEHVTLRSCAHTWPHSCDQGKHSGYSTVNAMMKGGIGRGARTVMELLR